MLKLDQGAYFNFNLPLHYGHFLKKKFNLFGFPFPANFRVRIPDQKNVGARANQAVLHRADQAAPVDDRGDTSAPASYQYTGRCQERT